MIGRYTPVLCVLAVVTAVGALAVTLTGRLTTQRVEVVKGPNEVPLDAPQGRAVSGGSITPAMGSLTGDDTLVVRARVGDWIEVKPDATLRQLERGCGGEAPREIVPVSIGGVRQVTGADQTHVYGPWVYGSARLLARCPQALKSRPGLGDIQGAGS